MAENQLKINIAPDKAQGVFANLALIAHTPTEFVLDFAQLMPGGSGKENPRCISE